MEPVNSDTALEHALASLENRLTRLLNARKAYLLQLDSEIDDVKRAIAAVSAVARSVPRENIAVDDADLHRRLALSVPKDHSVSAQIRMIARELLEKSEKPLDRRTILEAVLSCGVKISAKDAAKFVGRVLWRSPDFVNDGNGYRLLKKTVCD